MTAITLVQNFDDFDEDFPVRYPLEYLEQFGVRTVMHDAVHKAATHRKVIGVLGGKGLGKSVSLPRVKAWFEQREHLRAEVNNGYAPQRMLIRKSSRHDTYVQTLVGLSMELDARKAVRERGRSKSPAQLLEQTAIILREKRFAVIALDEGEVLNKETINAFRDVVAMAGDMARDLTDGVGLVIVGTPSAEGLLLGHEETGHRIAEVIRIKDVTIEDAYAVIRAWLPQAADLEGLQAERLNTVVRVKICKDRPTHMRKLEWLVKEYARRLQLTGALKGVTGWAGVPINLKLLEIVADAYPEGPGDGLTPMGGGRVSRGRRG